MSTILTAPTGTAGDAPEIAPAKAPTAPPMPEREPVAGPDATGVDREDRAVRRDRRTVALLAAVASIVATVVVYRSGMFGIGGDEFAHLLSARRVVDSPTRGFAQLGQYWLPLFHVLELPFTMIGPLYRSGLAGSLPAMLMFVVGTVGAYQLGWELTRDRRAAVIAAVAFGANPNMLYLQALPMLESTIAATLVWSAASLAGFARRGRTSDAVVAAAWVLLATWAHYGAWFLPLYGAALISIVAYRRGFSAGRAKFVVTVFVLLAGYGIALWLAWGWFIQHDALYALNKAGTNLASMQASSQFDDIAFNRGRPGNLGYAIVSYGGAIVAVFGPMLAAIGAAVTLAGLARRRFIHPLGAAGASAVFVIAFLFLKGGTIGSPLFQSLSNLDTPIAARDNVRYALFVAPFLAGAAAMMAGRRRWRQILVSLAVVASVAMVMRDGLITAPSSDDRNVDRQLTEVADMVALHYAGGALLTQSESGGDKVLWHTGRDLSNFVTEANGDVYKRALADPDLEVEWILVFPNSAISRRLSDAALRDRGFDLVDTYQYRQLTGYYVGRVELWRLAPEGA